MSNINKHISKKKKSFSTNCMHFSSVTDLERGEILCNKCGLVLLEKIEDKENSLISLTSDGQNNSRTGPPMSLTMYDKGLFTSIGSNKDASGNRIQAKAISAFSRLRVWDQRSKSDSTTRSMGKAFTILHGMRTKLGIPESVVEETAYIYRKAQAKKLTRGRSVTPVIAASLYASCRLLGIPRSLDEIAKSANVRRRILSKTIRVLIQTLDLKLEQYGENAFVSRISNDVGISEKTKRGAILILFKVKEAGESEGKNPLALAASAIYLSCLNNNESVVQTKLAKIAGVSAVSIRNQTANIRKILKL